MLWAEEKVMLEGLYPNYDGEPWGWRVRSVPMAGRGRGIGPDCDQDAATVVISCHRLCQPLLAQGRGPVAAICMRSVLCAVLSTVSCIAETRMP